MSSEGFEKEKAFMQTQEARDTFWKLMIKFAGTMLVGEVPQ